MKKLILFIACSFIALLGHGQMIVEDPAMLGVTEANWAAQLEQAGEQMVELKEHGKFLQQQIDRFKKINSIVRNARQVQAIIEKQVKLVSLIADEIGNAKKNINSDRAFDSFQRKLLNYSSASLDNVRLLETLLMEGALHFSDYERMRYLEELDDQINSIIYSCQYEIRRYNQLNDAVGEFKRLTGI